jgi:hypothetical protein
MGLGWNHDPQTQEFFALALVVAPMLSAGAAHAVNYRFTFMPAQC